MRRRIAALTVAALLTGAAGVSAQVYALVGEEVRRGTEDVVRAVFGQDPDQGSVRVERDRSDVHACILPDSRAMVGRHGFHTLKRP